MSAWLCRLKLAHPDDCSIIDELHAGLRVAKWHSASVAARRYGSVPQRSRACVIHA
jgi:hypothetical protein